MSAALEPRVEALLNHLTAWAREELAAQKGLLAALEEQSDAVRDRKPERLEQSNLAVDVALEQSLERSQRREKLFAQLAECWQVAPGTLTLGSILVRAGERGRSLADLRTKLREAAGQVQRTGRQVRALLRLHHQITSEILTGLLGTEGEGPGDRRGALVDAEV